MARHKPVDSDGTPFHALYVDRVVDREITELLGLARGIICDGMFNDAEVVALKQWFKANPDVTVTYPGNVLAARVIRVLEDGVIDEEERKDLKQMLLELVGEPNELSGEMDRATRLPLTEPVPTLLFDNREFVFTGRCASGSRKKVEQMVKDRGGRCAEYLTSKTDYLVVGIFASPAWIQSAHGRKIEEAAAMRASGHRIAIVSEEYFVETCQLDA